MKAILKTLAILALPAVMAAQSAKVQTAWRNLDDYNNSKDVSSLMKAKEAIDLATAHENTKNEAKTWAYRTRIYYALFQNAIEQEEKKLAATITSKDERLTKAYGNTPTADFEEASKSMQKLVELDKDMTYLKDPNFAMIGMRMMNDVSNVAIGKYNAGLELDKAGKPADAKAKLLQAAEYFETSYEMTKVMGNKKDTSALSSALTASAAARDGESIKKYAQKMITEKVATAHTFGDLYDSQMNAKDSAGAMQTLAEGIKAFPNDSYLRSRETEHMIRSGKSQEAIDNLDKLIAQTPNNPTLYRVKANIYDNMANPKDAKGHYMDKPKNFEELMTKAEAGYKKASELDPTNLDLVMDLGVLYNNWGGYEQGVCETLTKQATKQKECEERSTDLFNKAIPNLEKVLASNPGRRDIMPPLLKLYLLTNQNDKAQKITDQLNKK